MHTAKKSVVLVVLTKWWDNESGGKGIAG